MRTIKPGVIPSEQLHRGECSNCHGIFEEERQNLREEHASNGVDKVLMQGCPTDDCGATVFFRRIYKDNSNDTT